MTLSLSSLEYLLKYLSKSIDFLESWISKIFPLLLSVIIKASFPLVSFVALNSSQFIDSGKVGCLRTVWEEISDNFLSILETETSNLLEISFSL